MHTPRRGVVWEIGDHAGMFSLIFLGLFALTFGFLWLSGATPNIPSDSPATIEQQTPVAHVSNGQPDAPVRIVAKDIGLDTSVSNPTSTDVDVLDEALLNGAVRYPTSGMLGVDGTVLLFGHSSYLPIVHNQAYKTFDGIQNLKDGASVSVYSGSLEYRYSVTSVRLADATQDKIDLPQTGKHLVLVTCDSFAKKTSRFIVEADFVGSYSLQ